MNVKMEERTRIHKFCQASHFAAVSLAPAAVSPGAGESGARWRRGLAQRP